MSKSTGPAVTFADWLRVTMTAAQDVVFAEFDWSPMLHDQAIDRCYGRMNDMHGATGWYFGSDTTIDPTIVRLLDNKRVECDASTDGDLRDDMDSPTGRSSIFTDLVAELTERALSKQGATQ